MLKEIEMKKTRPQKKENQDGYTGNAEDGVGVCMKRERDSWCSGLVADYNNKMWHDLVWPMMNIFNK